MYKRILCQMKENDFFFSLSLSLSLALTFKKCYLEDNHNNGEKI